MDYLLKHTIIDYILKDNKLWRITCTLNHLISKFIEFILCKKI